jgi:Na+/citrate or Na+/malate symporter
LDNGLVRGFQSKHWAWWYLTIGLGFLLLAVVYLLQGARLAAVILRISVAIGFALLGWMQYRFGR